MIARPLGRDGRVLNAIGLGCMGLSEFYGPAAPTKDAVALLHAALELGVAHFDTAEMYGMGANETLLGQAFADRRGRAFIATKFGPMRDPKTGAPIGVDGSEANCRRAIEGSLARLKTDHVDLYYLHRLDKRRPVEETVGAMAKLVAEGKVRSLGLSEVSGETLRRAHKVHPITAVQSEYSIFSRDIEEGLLPACRELGVSLVAYSPLGRGLLTGSYASGALAPRDGDFRTQGGQPRFEAQNLAANLALVEEIKAVAAAAGVTPGQVALAWVLGRGECIHTIPGTTKRANLEANLAAGAVTLTEAELARLDGLADRVQGDRYNARGMASLDR